MSLYVADVGIVKIKPEYVEAFGYLFDGEYEKAADSGMFDKFFLALYSDSHFEWVREIRYWKHNNEKKEWEGKYITSYENGIFTYGISYNHYNNSYSYFVGEFFEMLRGITEEEIAWDGWCEE